METKANYAIVGFFTVMVIVAAFGFVYWMAEYGRGGPLAELTIRIPGSANGLSIGSPVRFNGIPVGSVRSLAIDANDPRYSIALTEVRADAPVYASTRAILEVQGLTGAAYIELSGGRKEDVNILQRAIDTGERAVLLADQSSVTNLLATADKILDRANDAIGEIQAFVTDARVPLTNTVKNAEVFSKALSDNAGGVDKFLESVSALSTTITGISGRLDATLVAVENLVKAVDANKIRAVVSNAEKVSNDIASASGDIKPTIESFRQTADTFRQFGENAEKTLDRVEKLVAAVDTEKVSTSVNNISAATADAREAAASFRNLGKTIDNHEQDIDQIIADAKQIANTLSGASKRVDGVLAKVDGLLGSGDTQSLFTEARATLESFKKVADSLNARIGPIADNLSRFTGTGLRDAQALIEDARRTVNNLNSTISGFDRDPQRLLFGGETVKEYNGRSRY
ncbi:MCE family protein [Rhizobiaceae bacterium n13]|uniref:MCE family protein n=1 Tax=Ferirhizobium litorale TaxID=2927786 RepID=A0AAE3U2M7_9HYPH|nr:MlaD family protein [Fererhizobium litorale]MDI7863889.1 MCE family protein [Fererhizobium litorale]MDI7924279.1 MCE family protein [Fererhizobium litorale]